MEWKYDCLMGGGQRVRLPSDGVDPTTLHGRCKSYFLGKPMTLRQLETMPGDLQRDYLRRLRQRGGSQEEVLRMLRAAPEQLRQLQERYHIRFDCPDPKRWADFCRDEGRDR